MSLNTNAGNTIYQLKISLLRTDPPIWRKIQVTGDTTLADLHEMIGVLMDWHGDHLHEFDVRGTKYSDPDADLGTLGERILDETRAMLVSLAPTKGFTFLYTYDFGDNWDHLIEVEQVLEPRPGGRYPLYLGGERAAPPDDVGGAWRYEAVLEVLKDPEDSNYEDWHEWLGDWDPDYIDVDGIKKWMKGF